MTLFMSHHQFPFQISSYKVQAPFTATWKSEEALTEIDAFKQRLEQIKVDVVSFEVEKLVEGFALKGRFSNPSCFGENCSLQNLVKN